MTPAFKKATSSQAFLKVGLFGAAGSGKTLTSLLFAEGLVKGTGKRIAFVDTEQGSAFYSLEVPERKVHPAAFDFDVLNTRSLMDTLEAVEGLDPAVYGIVILDSVTHLWEAAKDAYRGKLTSQGGIPITAWSGLKKPWKRLISLLLDGDYHVILCGREGVEMAEGDDGEPVVVGRKMKAEGETAYEPHLTARMEPRRAEDKSFIISAFWLKDRSGVLSGRHTDWPNYDTIAPVVHYLTGKTQGKLGLPEESSDRDAEAQVNRQAKEDAEKQEVYSAIRTAITTAKTLDALKAAWDLTRGKKGKLGDLFADLEVAKETAKAELMKGVV